jgi:hypothetical protein
MSGNRRKRLERLEQKLSDVIRQEALVNCICLDLVFAWSTEKFLSEINQTCPVHGFRRFESITLVYRGPSKNDLTRSPDDPALGLEEAVKEYRRRLAQVEQAEDEKEYGCEEH